MEKLFKQGDVVVLKSGGPKMTVSKYEWFHDVAGALMGKESQPSRETENVKCVWFDNNTTKQGVFHQSLLKLVES